MRGNFAVRLGMAYAIEKGAILGENFNHRLHRLTRIFNNKKHLVFLRFWGFSEEVASQMIDGGISAE